MAVSESAACAIAADPAVDRLGVGERVDRRPGAVDELGEAAREIDRAAVDVVERQHAMHEPPILLGHRDAEEDPVQTASPGVGLQRAELERLAVAGVEPPADPARRDPVLHSREVVVVEPEPPAHGLASGQVEQLRRGRALVGERQQLTDHAEHRVGLAQRPVGEPDAQVGQGLAVVAGEHAGVVLVLVTVSSGAERGLDQRRERLDVGAHDDHVARLERRVVLEQVQDRVAQHLDLAGAAVAGVDLDAAVVGV